MRKRKHPDCDCIQNTTDMDMINQTISETIAASLKVALNESPMNTELKKVSASLDALNTTVTCLRADNASFKEALNSINNRLDGIDQCLGISDARQDTFDERLKALETKLSQISSATPECVAQLESKLASMEQQSRDCNIEIVNVPDRRNENLITIVTNLGLAIKQQVLASDIVAVHRVPHADKNDTRPKNIIVKFTTRVLRDNILTASRTAKGLHAEQLGIATGTPQRIYVNEHLTLRNKKLFRECRERARKYEFKYVWVKHGIVLVRKSDSAPVLAIRTELDIHKIK